MPTISKIIGVDIATIAKINNIAIGDIGSITGADVPQAAIAFDAASNSVPTSDSNETQDSWAHVTGTGLTDSILIIGVAWRNSGSNTYVVSSITYGGSAAGITLARGPDGQDSGSSRRTALYYLKNPGSGSKTIQVNFTGGVFVIQCGAATFQGVDQTTPIGNSNGQNSSSEDPVNVVVNTTYSNNVVVDILALRGNALPRADGTPDGTQTEIFARNGHSTNYGIFAGMSYKGPNSSGNVTMEWDIADYDGEPYTAMSAVELNPA